MCSWVSKDQTLRHVVMKPLLYSHIHYSVRSYLGGLVMLYVLYISLFVLQYLYRIPSAIPLIYRFHSVIGRLNGYNSDSSWSNNEIEWGRKVPGRLSWDRNTL